ncbi:Cloroperoxidase [Rickenella mellea]|uniref:Cloroperoxidase n=1 Tax=Rickenella mellea TaxID=50990 RepID=A0A4Y7PTH9_9AGAM|nr:Cloroperoxidase [Rickenella mellea]
MSDIVPTAESSPPSPHHSHATGTCPFVKNPHAFCPPTEGDSRAPCPALNTLANHGYLPRNGKHLSGQTIVHALEQGYNCSTPLAYFLTYAGILALGQFVDFSLSDLGRHNRIEHNASLVHGDAGPNEYAPTRVVDAALERLLGDSRDGRYLTAEDVGEARVRRESVYKTEIDGFHAEVARGEMALVLGIFGHHNTDAPSDGVDHVPLDIAKTWFKEERLPEGWKPSHRQTLIETVKASTAIRHAMQELRKDTTAVEVLKAREEGALNGRPVSIATTSTSTSTSTSNFEFTSEESAGSSYDAMSTDDDAGTTTTADDSMEVSTPDTSPTPSRDEVPVWQKQKQEDRVLHEHDEEVVGEVVGDCPTPQAIHV